DDHGVPPWRYLIQLRRARSLRLRRRRGPTVARRRPARSRAHRPRLAPSDRTIMASLRGAILFNCGGPGAFGFADGEGPQSLDVVPLGPERTDRDSHHQIGRSWRPSVALSYSIAEGPEPSASPTARAHSRSTSSRSVPSAPTETRTI